MSNVITPILFFVSAIGLFFTYINPNYETLLSYQEQEKQVQKAVEDYKNLKGTRESLLDTYIHFAKNDLDRLNKILPDKVDVVALILEIDNLAYVNNIIINSFGLENLTSNENIVGARSGQSEVVVGVGTGSLELSCTGSYFSMKTFLHDLESSLTLTDIVDFSITLGTIEHAEGEVSDEFSYTISLQTYWLKQ